ncbi:tyrosine-type recombinase/integrase [Sphaerotilus sulfidivorans]
MASLELIHYIPHRIIVDDKGVVRRERDQALRPIRGLPQIFWADGSSWRAVNLWAHSRATNGLTDIKTVRSNLSHLHKYAQWLEGEQLDWRHFPMLERDRVLIRWRKHLIEQRDRLGLLAPSTASHRMNATIAFYRFAQVRELIGRDAPLWQERQVVHRYSDSVGFERTLLLRSTNLTIPNRARHGLKLENGLSPLTDEQRQELLAFTSRLGNASRELDLMLKLGFFSGARIETIADLKRDTILNASPAPNTPGLVFLSVGPGHRPHVATKFDVNGQIVVPAALLEDLRDYLVDVSRLKREALAAPEDKDLVFLTRYGRRYVDPDSGSGSAVGRAMVDLRRKATQAGLAFAKHFHFHMTRATFGTSLTSLLLSQEGATEKEVLDLVSTLMLHKDVSTTLKYIKFVTQARMKAKVANEFSEAYLGLSTRLGG